MHWNPSLLRMKEENFEDYIYINKLFFSLIGIWPLPDGAPTWRLYIQNFHSITVVNLLWLLLIIPMVLDLYVVWGDINAMIQNVYLTTHAIFISVKLSHVIANRGILKELLTIMKYNWDASASKYRKEILLKHANFARNITKAFVLSVYYFETLVFLLPIIYGIDSDPVRKRRYPLCAWYYYDQNSNLVYIFCYLSQVFGSCGLGAAYIIGMDSFFCVAIYHACAQLNILQSELIKVGDGSEFSEKRMKQLIQNHNAHLRTVQKINQLFSQLCLYQLMTSCIVICSAGFQLIIALSGSKIDFHSVFTYIGFILANLFQILLYCWPGNELMGQSLEVGNAAYQCLWTNLSQDSSKAVMMIILRAQKPMIISAGGMYEMTLRNFTAIMKVSMSSLSLLRTINANH